MRNRGNSLYSMTSKYPVKVVQRRSGVKSLRIVVLQDMSVLDPNTGTWNVRESSRLVINLLGYFLCLCVSYHRLSPTNGLDKREKDSFLILIEWKEGTSILKNTSFPPSHWKFSQTFPLTI